MALRSHACVAFCFALTIVSPASAKNHDIREVFRDFEALCFSYAANGYGLDLALLIEKAGFTFVQKTRDGSDVFNADAIQLVIGDKGCALGMPSLPFRQMSEWTEKWADVQSLVDTMTMPSPAGPQYRVWTGMGFDVRLQEDKFSDGTVLTGLILTRR